MQASLASAGPSLPSRPCSWPPPHPALCTGEKVNEVMSPRPAELQGASSQPKKGFIGFVKLASCDQRPPGTRQHHRGKKEKQTMKLKGISFPELSLTRGSQECVSPWFLLLPSSPVPGLCRWCSHTGQGRSSHGDTCLLGSHLEALDPRIKALEGLLGKEGYPGDV